MQEAKIIITILLPGTIAALCFLGLILKVAGKIYLERKWLMTLYNEIIEIELEKSEEDEVYIEPCPPPFDLALLLPILKEEKEKGDSDNMDHLFDFSDVCPTPA